MTPNPMQHPFELYKERLQNALQWPEDLFEKFHESLGPAERDFFAGLEAFTTSGRQTFELGPTLVREFLNTSLKSVDFSMLHMPYGAFYVQFPKEFKLIVADSEKVAHGFVVRLANNGTQIRFVVYAPSENPNDPFDDVLYAYGLDYKKEGDVEAVLAGLKAHCEEDFKVKKSEAFIEGQVHYSEVDCAPEGFVASLLASTRIFFHLLLYLSSPDAELERDVYGAYRRRIEDKAKKERKEHRKERILERLNEVPSTIVTKVFPSLERDSTKEASDESTRAGVRKHLVRGHWRAQWYGSGTEKHQQPVWIRPFWKGTGDAPDARVYKVDK